MGRGHGGDGLRFGVTTFFLIVSALLGVAVAAVVFLVGEREKFAGGAADALDDHFVRLDEDEDETQMEGEEGLLGGGGSGGNKNGNDGNNVLAAFMLAPIPLLSIFLSCVTEFAVPGLLPFMLCEFGVVLGRGWVGWG